MIFARTFPVPTSLVSLLQIVELQTAITENRHVLLDFQLYKTRSVFPQNAHYSNRKRIRKYGLNRTVSFEDISSIIEEESYVEL